MFKSTSKRKNDEKKMSKNLKSMNNSNSQTDDEYVLESGITARLYDSQEDNFRHIELYEAAYEEEEHFR